MLRNAVWNSCYFGTSGLRAVYAQRHGREGHPIVQQFVNFLCGAAGGALGVICNTPLDVVKSRMQDPTQTGHHNSIVSSLRHIARNEGVGALYKGLAPRMFRLGLGGGVMMCARCSCLSRHLLLLCVSANLIRDCCTVAAASHTTASGLFSLIGMCD